MNSSDVVISSSEEYITKCLIKSITIMRKEIQRRESTDILKYMGRLPADLGYHYLINMVNSKNERIRFLEGKFSGSKTSPTSWSDAWEKFSKIRSTPEKAIIDRESLHNSFINGYSFLSIPRTFTDIFCEGFGNRVRLIIRFTPGIGCMFWWIVIPLDGPDTGKTTFCLIDDYHQFFLDGNLVDSDFTYSQFQHTQMLDTLKSILIEHPELARELGIDESLLTDEPWPDSTQLELDPDSTQLEFDMAKFAIFLANLLMRQVISPKGKYNFAESVKNNSK